jgi:signal transduction histidine kinase
LEEVRENKYLSGFTHLKVTEYPEFTDLDIGSGYKLNFYKIGESIVYSKNNGNMKSANIKKYYETFEDFLSKANIQKPYIEIRDFGNLTGRAPSKEIQFQTKYLKEHEKDYLGFIVCNIRGIMEIVVKSAFKLIKSPVKVFICQDHQDALQKAELTLGDSTISEDHCISQRQIQFNQEWNFVSTSGRIKYGFIPGIVFYTSLEGNFDTEDLPLIRAKMAAALKNGKFQNKEYIRIADYTLLAKLSFAVRSQYGKIVEDLDKEHNCKPRVTYVLGAKGFTLAAMYLYKISGKQNMIFTESLEHTFDLIDDQVVSEPTSEHKIKVKQSDIDEIVNLGGSLIWGSEDRIEEMVSADNPLLQVASTLGVVQNDLMELRKRDATQHKILSESLAKSRQLTDELRKSDQETQRLNDELKTTNKQLFAQKQELEEAQSELTSMNQNLEKLVKKRTVELKKTVDKLNKSVSELDRFVYSASHDLSAPLKSMLGLIQIARKDPGRPHIFEYLDHIEKSIFNLEDVIKSLISYSRNSRLVVECEEVNLKSLVEEVINELAYLPQSEAFSFKMEIPDGHTILTDKRRLKIVLNNLINNSIKYAEREKANPFVCIKIDPDSSEIVVEDNGIGIPADQQDKVFNMFHRATEISKGSGLGLFIVKETVNALNAEIYLKSAPDQGTSFFIKLPQ